MCLGVGMLGALAFASENAHQSWSAVFLEDELAVPVGVSALGPAIFAGVVAATRFSVSRLPVRHARSLVVAGAMVTTAGTVGLALAPVPPLALVALTFAAIGAAVLFPALLGFVSRAVSERHRGRATSIVTVVAYTGFVAGPPVVGILSGLLGLRGGMLGVAVLTALLAVATPFVLRAAAVSVPR